MKRVRREKGGRGEEIERGKPGEGRRNVGGRWEKEMKEWRKEEKRGEREKGRRVGERDDDKEEGRVIKRE